MPYMQFIELYLLFAMVAVVWFDVTRYIIPNWLVGSLVLLYPLWVWLYHPELDWKMALAAMGIVFAVGYGIYMMKWMGAGDIKFLTGLSLWVGYAGLVDFLITVALLGGVLSVGLWLGRKPLPRLMAGKTLPRILREGEPVPYGVAISVAFLLAVMAGKIPGFVW